MFPVCLPPRLSPPLVLQPSLVVPSGEGPLHLPSPGCTTLYSKMMSLRIPSRGPLSAHKTVFLQLNTYGLSAFQLLLYHSPPNPNPPFVSFPFLSQSKKKANYRKQGTSPNRPQAVNIPTALSNASHRCSTRVSGKEKTRTFQLQREWKKAEQKKRKQKKRQGGKVISSWKLGHKFGRRCSVYMTSCIVTHYLLLLDAERLRPALRNGK